MSYSSLIVFAFLKNQNIGYQIIEDKCSVYYTAKVGDIDMKIECLYFSAPRIDAFFEIDDEEVDETDSTSADQEETSEAPTDPAVKKEKQTKTIEIKDGETLGNYNYVIEKYEVGGVVKPGILKGVLTIKDVTEKSMKNYKFKLDDAERDIRIGKDKESRKNTLYFFFVSNKFK